MGENKTDLKECEIEIIKKKIEELTGRYDIDPQTFYFQFIKSRMEENNIGSLQEYFEFIESLRGVRERNLLIDNIVNRETFFFRMPEQFFFLKEKVFPKLFLEKDTINILSCGCSTGQEPYSIAIVVKESKFINPNVKVNITALDISKSNIEIASQAKYQKFNIERTSSKDWKEYLYKYSEYKDGYYVLKEEIRSMVTFKQYNILNRQMKYELGINKWDIIFCRYLLLYFRDELIKATIAQFYDMIKEGGYLFTDYSLNSHFLKRYFKLFFIKDGFVYIKKPKGEEKTEGEIEIKERGSLDYYTLAVYCLEQDKPEESIYYLKKQIEEGGEATKAKLLLARIYLDIGEIEESEKLCRELLKGKHSARLYYILGEIAYQRGELDNALEKFKNAKFLEPDYPFVYFRAAEIYQKKNELGKARRELKSAIEIYSKLNIDSLPYDELLFLGGGFNPKEMVNICNIMLESL